MKYMQNCTWFFLIKLINAQHDIYKVLLTYNIIYIYLDIIFIIYSYSYFLKLIIQALLGNIINSSSKLLYTILVFLRIVKE